MPEFDRRVEYKMHEKAYFTGFSAIIYREKPYFKLYNGI